MSKSETYERTPYELPPRNAFSEGALSDIDTDAAEKITFTPPPEAAPPKGPTGSSLLHSSDE
jgi:hypothetical protein